MANLKNSSTTQCYFCGQKSEDKNEVIEHIKVEHDPNLRPRMFGPPRETQCEKCKVVFTNIAILKLHICGRTNPSIKITNDTSRSS